MADLRLPKPTRATLQVFANDVNSAGDAHTPVYIAHLFLHSYAQKTLL